ncbi:MAG: hypothetical protein K8L99_23580, partial [Anaerolineae bacterium]|nr:hypothetical protein [Anaerolineae bacterium]
MNNQTPSVENNNRAEGSPEARENREPLATVQTTSMPTLRLNDRRGPAAETGIIEMVVASAEANENKDSQDASRSAAETAAAPRKESLKQHPAILIIEDSTELAEIIEATLQRLD